MSRSFLSEPKSYHTRVWNWLTRPSSHVHEPDCRRQARILAAWHIILVPAGCLMTLANNLLMPAAPLFRSEALPLFVFTIAILCFTYVLSRTTAYGWSAFIAICAISFHIYVSAALDLSGLGANLLYYLVFPLVAMSLFFSIRVTLGFAVLNLIALAVLPLLGLGFLLSELLLGPITFVTLGAFMVGVVSHQRNLLEYSRRRELAASTQQLRLVTENMNDIVCYLDGDGYLQYASPSLADVLGYHFSADTAQPPREWLKLVHPDDYVQVERDVQEMLAGRRSLTTRGRIRHADGQYVWLEGNSNPLREPRGDASGVILVTRDITHTKRAEEERLELAVEREKLHLLRRFISDLSHDLRNPLANIGTSLYLLKRATTPEKQAQYMDSMATHTAHLERVLKDLLTIGSLESDTQNLHFQRLDIQEFLETLTLKRVAEAADHGHFLQYTSSEGNWHILGDSGYLERALTHILQNAMAHTPQGGTIRVSTAVMTDAICIQVEDSGSGIDAQDLPHIFDHFYRGDKARSTATGGAGLGLTIAKRIIEAHGGEIVVSSPPEQGVRVTVQIPLIPDTQTDQDR